MGSAPSTSLALVLRRRENFDMEPLVDLWVASWQEAMPDIDFSARRDWLEDHIVGLEAKGFVTICAEEHFPANQERFRVAKMRPDKVEEHFPGRRLLGFVTLDPATGWVDQLAVAPSAKGGGAALLLLDEARRLAPRGLSLDVNVDNPRALRFYEREGFTRIGEGVNPHSGLATLRLLRRGDC